ncbi:tyrosine-type recombinase/integrase [Mycolicibacterium obuense]|uniref:tyrosine-type recombinase/integrase n=1 Tax=Mycolicibacterium obuense TaxID=1807 RepID=UPI000A50FF8B|nr:tyrosine-type recombinase/integrase [Mycolicibacterium obuense]
MSLERPRSSGKRTGPEKLTAAQKAHRQLTALAELSVDEAEARLVLDWKNPLRHGTYTKAIFRPAVMRANRLYPHAAISDDFTPHGLRHTYASLCVAAGLPMFEISRFMGHAKPSTTETVYAHLLRDDHTTAMAALGAMAAPTASNVVALRAN